MDLWFPAQYKYVDNIFLPLMKVTLNIRQLSGCILGPETIFSNALLCFSLILPGKRRDVT